MSSAYALCREFRRRSGLSQRALAERAGVSASTVARIERGRLEPTLAMLQRLADAAGVEVRIQIADIDWADRARPDDLSFDERLAELHAVIRIGAELRGR